MNSSPKFISNLEITKDENEKSNLQVNSENYQSITKNISIGLTAYESVCAPRTIQNESAITFSKEQISKVIEEVLRCNICYNLFQNPVSVKGCLHKFCKSCISDYYFKIKKECAICRHPIETKRLLKEDNKIKEIINCFIPDQNKFKDEEDKILSLKAKEFVFKDENKHMLQNDKEKIDKNKSNNNNINNNPGNVLSTFFPDSYNNENSYFNQSTRMIFNDINTQLNISRGPSNININNNNNYSFMNLIPQNSSHSVFGMFFNDQMNQ